MNHPTIYAYSRTLYRDKVLVLLNFSKDLATIDLGNVSVSSKPVLNNYEQVDITGNTVRLEPYQAVVFGMK